MKANAPEKLWIDPATDLPKLSGHIDKNDVEYTRTDAFIEKACALFRRIDYDDTIPPYETTEEFIKYFKKYMKGE